MVVFARNKQGLRNLWNLSSQTSHPDYFYYKPRIHLFNSETENGTAKGLESFVGPDKDIIGISGHMGSTLSDSLFFDPEGDPKDFSKAIRTAYGQYKGVKTDYYKQFLRPNWLEETSKLALKLEGIFGKGNFFIELQDELNPNDQLALWIQPLIVDCLRQVSIKTKIPAIASSDPHYAVKSHAPYQRAMVMAKMRETEAGVQAKLGQEDTDLMVFFGSDEFYIKSRSELENKFSEKELDLTNEIAEQIEEYDLKERPIMPVYDPPQFKTNDNKLYDLCKTDLDRFLVWLCIRGMNTIKPWEDTNKPEQIYWNRLKEELEVIIEAQLNNYLVIVWDMVLAAKNRPRGGSFDWLKNYQQKGDIDPIPISPGRGSAAGCLIIYLIGITKVDPIKYNLLFSRFYNSSRNTKDHVALPDIDVDFAIEGRDWVLQYLRYKYGAENVSAMITFGRLQGKAAVKDMFRVKDVPGGFELSNEICKYIPDEAEIADEIQEMHDAGDDNYGVLQWALDNSEDLKQYAENELLKEVFEYAKGIEGRFRNQSKHASGVIVTPKKVSESFPMTYDPKSKEQIVALDMKDAEKCGSVKLDILGLSCLSKLSLCERLVKNNNE